MGGKRCQGDWQLVRPNTVRLPCRTYSRASLPTRPTEAVLAIPAIFRGRDTRDDAARLAPMGMLMDMWFNPTHHAIQPFAGHEVREDERPVTAHSAAIPIHDAKIGFDIRSKINFIDDEEVRACDAWSALARNLVALGHIDHVDGVIRKFRTEGCGKVITTALDKH